MTAPNTARPVTIPRTDSGFENYREELKKYLIGKDNRLMDDMLYGLDSAQLNRLADAYDTIHDILGNMS